jgi:hypothetical protein
MVERLAQGSRLTVAARHLTVGAHPRGKAPSLTTPKPSPSNPADASGSEVGHAHSSLVFGGTCDEWLPDRRGELAPRGGKVLCDRTDEPSGYLLTNNR